MTDVSRHVRRRMREEADIPYGFAHVHDTENLQSPANTCCVCGGRHCCCTCPRRGGSGVNPVFDIPVRQYSREAR